MNDAELWYIIVGFATIVTGVLTFLLACYVEKDYYSSDEEDGNQDHHI